MSTLDRWSRVEALYHAAKKRDVEERAAFLEAACAGDVELRCEVESLLAQPVSVTGFLDRAAMAVPAQMLSETASVQDRGLRIGARLGRYEILAEVGAGGMGRVYKARDSHLKRFVAIKVLPSEFSTDPERKRRLDHEARVIAILNHPHICTLHDVGHLGGIDYLVMEYLDGQTLRLRLQGTRLPPDEALQIATQIGEALSQAHEQGIVHRDLKPENIMLTKGGAKLLDFGVARIVDTLDSRPIDQQTAAGSLLGTVAYMSPEQVRGLQIDPRSDVFSFGVVLYEMAAGTRPFRGANAIETIDAILHQQPQSLSAQDLGGFDELEHVVCRCLEKEPEHRYQSMKELLAALGRVGGSAARGLSVRSGPNRRHNLPLPLTKFIGRERQIEELEEVLDDVRLLTLTGSGGCGKSRLGLEVASKLVRRFTDGVWLVELAPVSSPELVPHAVASALGIQDEPGRPLTQRLADYLEAKQLLLLLDNCEHLVTPCATLVETLLKSCGNLKVLATSRQPLRALGERLWRVPSLSFPDSTNGAFRVQEAGDYEAVQLFVERARHVSSFEFDEPSAVAVAEICQRLDGIPLALEMAAARLNVLSVHQVAERLRDRFRLLAGHVTSALPRQQTLRRTIDWSYSLLSYREQALFQRLAVFASSFNLMAVEAVCSEQDLQSDDLLDVLSGLLEKSMVAMDSTSLETRYRMLESLREYALEKLCERGHESRTRDKHSEFFARLAEGIEPELYKSQSAHWYDRLQLDHQNLLTALEWCHSKSRSLVVLRLAGSLHPFWAVRGHRHYEYLKEMLLHALANDHGHATPAVRARSLDAAGALFEDLNAARLLYEESLRLWNDLRDEKGVAGALHRLGVNARRRGDSSTAGDLQRQSLEIYRRRKDRMGIAGCLDDLGYLAFDSGDYEAADSYWKESLEIWRELSFERGLAVSLSNNARLARVRADYVKAEALCTESLTLSRRLGDEVAIAQRLTQLGGLYFDTDYPRARALFEEGLAVFRSLGFKRSIAGTLIALSDLACCEGDYEHARHWLNESLTLYKQLDEGESPNAAECLIMLGVVAFEQGEYESALDLSQRGAELFSRLSRPAALANSLCRVGWARLAKDDHVGALASFEESLNMAVKAGRIVGLAEPHCGVGYVLLLEGNYTEAWSHFHDAFVSYEQRNDRTGMIYALLPLGEVSLARGEYESASHLYERALQLAVDLGFKKGIARALRSLGTIATLQRLPELAARRYGACHAVLEAMGGKLPAFQSSGYDSALARARSELGEAPFERLWQEGRTTPSSCFPHQDDRGRIWKI